MDLYSRRIVGWAMSDSLHRKLVMDALQMAIANRQPPPGLLHHSEKQNGLITAITRRERWLKLIFLSALKCFTTNFAFIRRWGIIARLISKPCLL
jgi:hypothetical protein